MDAISLFEQLANITHHQVSDELIDKLPIELKHAFITSNSQLIREKIAGQHIFPDSRAVIQG